MVVVWSLSFFGMAHNLLLTISTKLNTPIAGVPGWHVLVRVSRLLLRAIAPVAQAADDPAYEVGLNRPLARRV